MIKKNLLKVNQLFQSANHGFTSYAVVVTLCFIMSIISIVAYRLFVNHPLEIGGTRSVVLIAALCIVYSSLLLRDKTKQLFVRFFGELTAPFNLAFFRIIFFTYLFLEIDISQVLWFSNLPKELQFPPIGMKTLLCFIPVNQIWALAASSLFKIFCLLAIFGLFTRFSCLMAAITGFYILAIPELYGKVNHYHHLFWFLAIFAVSRCGDALSVDALRNAWKKADQKDFSQVGPSKSYALPLRFMWILMGICYLFPGLWKLWESGSQWIFGDNLKCQMYYDWMGFNGWLPPFRLDHYPLLCHLSGGAVIFFETTFIGFILFYRGRYFAFAEGLFFHNMTSLLMNISFYSLQLCYLSLLNWERIFSFFGKKLFKEEMDVLFDGNCAFCRRTIAFMKTFDIFGRIQYLDIYSSESVALRDKNHLLQDELVKDFHGIIGQRILKGLPVYQAMAVRIPILWPLWPILGLGWITKVGHYVYRRVADNRACRIVSASFKNTAVPSNVLLWTLGLTLIIGNMIFGFLKIENGWPFACYPTFSEIASDHFITIDCETVDTQSIEREITAYSLGDHLGGERISGLITSIINFKDSAVRKAKFLALWKVLLSNDPDLKRAQKVRFYSVEEYTDPSKKSMNPIRRVLVLEFFVNDELKNKKI